MSASNVCLELRDVRMSFGALHAVTGVSLRVDAGERHALLGTNGAGKTTLFNMITGDLLPTAGQVLLRGRDITRLPAHRRAGLGLGRTYQTPLLFNGLTVLENLVAAVRGPRLGGFSLRLLGPGLEWVRRAEDVCEQVGLAGHSGTPVQRLSHGQKKQLELGMALATGPSLLLLDEPAAGLSPDDRKLLVGLIRALPRELTLLLVEHDMEVALQLADRVTVMKDGKVFAAGAPDSIRHDANVLQMYLGAPLEIAA